MFSTNPRTIDHDRLRQQTYPRAPSLPEIFRPDSVLRFIDCESKSSAIDKLVRQLVATGRLAAKDANEIAQQINDREICASTALGKGFAFPHLRTHSIREFVGAIGMVPNGINFNSADRDVTQLIFLVVSPYNERQSHLDVLSRLASLLSNTAIIIRLTQCNDPMTFYRALCDLDHRPTCDDETPFYNDCCRSPSE